MPTSAYVDGTGATRQRSLAQGDGSSTTPDVANFAPDYLNDAPITGAGMPTGGAGIIGWASAIWLKLANLTGQATKANSLSVTIASDQTAIPVSGSFSYTPSGSQATTTDQLPTTLGQTTKANSVSVVIASDQTVPVSATSLPLPTNAAQDGTDATGVTAPSGAVGIRGWLSGLYNLVNSRFPSSLGQKTSANSIPVVIASDQSLTINASGSQTTTTDQLPTTLGQTTKANSVSVVIASDQTVPVSATSLPLPTNAAQDGTDATGVTAPSGATGIRGWLSGLYSNVLSLVNIFTRPSIIYISGTVSASGNNSIVAAPSSGSIWITHLVIQNESSAATTILVQGSSTQLRCLGQNQGNGLALTFPQGREFKLPATTALILNLSGANQCGYSIGYYTA